MASQDAPLPWYEGTTWTTTDGLPQNSVRDIVQTRDGFMWLATSGGLVRFNGVDFELFDITRESNPGSNRIIDLCESREGDLWISTEDGPGLARYRDGHFKHFEIKPTAIAARRAGGIWGVEAERLFSLDASGPTTLLEVPTASGTKPRFKNARDLYEAEDGLLYIATGKISRWDGQDLTPLPDWQTGIEFCENPEGGFWIAGKHGLRLIRLGQVVASWDKPMTGLAVDANGVLWVNSRDGMLRLNKQSQLLVSSRITGDHVRESEAPAAGSPMIRDQEGNMWVGDPLFGLTRFRRSRISGYTKADGLPREGAYTLCPDGDQGLYVGNRNRLMHFDGRNFTEVVDGGLKDEAGHIMALRLDRRGRLWVVKSDRLFRIVDGRTEFCARIKDVYARSVLEDSQGRLWIGSPSGLARITEAGQVDYSDHRGVQGVHVRSLAEDREGNLWVGMLPGVMRVGAQETTTFLPEDGMGPGAVRDILQAPDGAMWFGTYGGGLTRLWNGEFARVTTKDGLLDNAISRMIEDDHGFLYINSNRGVFRTSWSDLNAVVDGSLSALTCISYGVAPGMRTNEAQGGYQESGCKGADGRLWFPTIEGIVSIDPHKSVINQLAPPVVISSFETSDLLLEDPRTVELPIGKRSFAIQYAALSFSRPEAVRYRYRMQGHNDTWTEVGNERTARFSELGPGTYRFQVISANEDGLWNEEGASLSVTLPAYFYETRWFQLAALALVTALVVLASHRRNRAIAQRAQELEGKVRHRTAELRSAHDELNQRVRERTLQLASANDSLQADLEERERLQNQLLQAQKLESVGRLAGGISHDFNNLLTVMLGQTELAKIATQDPEMLERLGEIYDAGERATKLTNQLLTFSSGKITELHALDLRRLILGLEQILRRVLSASVELETQIAEDLGWIMADSTQIEQVLVNMCINARDAMPKGGKLTITARNDRLDAGQASEGAQAGLPPGDYVRISISDTGSGMQPETQEHIFEPFFTTKAVGEGTGLGLSVCYGIVKDYAGQIMVESTPDQGTTFEILFPRVEAEQVIQPAPAASPKPNPVHHVLLVEDNPRVRKVVEGMLKKLGFRVLVAEDEHEALALATDPKHRIDVLLTDVIMPNINGMDLAKQVREQRPDCRVLFISGYADNISPSQVTIPKGAQVLAKPFTVETLNARLDKLLSEPGPREPRSAKRASSAPSAPGDKS